VNLVVVSAPVGIDTNVSDVVMDRTVEPQISSPEVFRLMDGLNRLLDVPVLGIQNARTAHVVSLVVVTVESRRTNVISVVRNGSVVLNHISSVEGV